MKILAVIPARYESQRFPGKVLAMLGDRPMLQWVYEAAKGCAAFTKVLVVATDSEKVADCVRGFGGEVEMTRSDHPLAPIGLLKLPSVILPCKWW
jgi:3-deoxy-manno-octulosonate cytidylyltransferase (CMP-KDO synthetase)